MKPNINSVEVHPQLTNTHPMEDGALVGGGGLLWPQFCGSYLSGEANWGEVEAQVLLAEHIGDSQSGIRFRVKKSLRRRAYLWK